MLRQSLVRQLQLHQPRLHQLRQHQLPLRRLGAAAVVALTTLLPTSALAKINSLSDLFVFGDSLSDSGNSKVVSNNATGGAATLPPFPYFDGRFSNGLVAAEYLWQAFNPWNDSFEASLSGGTNYAIGGSTTGTENFIEVWDVTPDFLRPEYTDLGNAWQLAQFGAAAPVFNPATSLFLVWLFPNDLFYYASTTQKGVGGFDGTPPLDDAISPTDVVLNAVANITGSIQELATRGARNFLVVNSADLGLIPENLGSENQAGISLLSSSFNSALSSQISSLKGTAPQLDIEYFEIDQLFAEILSDPDGFGFTNVTDRCFLGASICAEPDHYLFWDGSHPTTRTHQLIAQRLYASVYQVPGPVPVFGVAVAFSWSRRLRRRLQNLPDQAGVSKNHP